MFSGAKPLKPFAFGPSPTTERAERGHGPRVGKAHPAHVPESHGGPERRIHPEVVTAGITARCQLAARARRYPSRGYVEIVLVHLEVSEQVPIGGALGLRLLSRVKTVA